MLFLKLLWPLREESGWSAWGPGGPRLGGGGEPDLRPTAAPRSDRSDRGGLLPPTPTPQPPTPHRRGSGRGPAWKALHSGSDLFTRALGECKQFSLSDFISLKGLSVNTNGY